MPMIIRQDIADALRAWRDGNHPHSPGSFLEYVLRNDLVKAAAHADSYNLATLGYIGQWVMWHIEDEKRGEHYDQYLESMHNAWLNRKSMEIG